MIDYLKPMQYRDGDEWVDIDILCTTLAGPYCTVGVVPSTRTLHTFTRKGEEVASSGTIRLRNRPERVTGWINIWHSTVHASQESAALAGNGAKGIIFVDTTMVPDKREAK